MKFYRLTEDEVEMLQGWIDDDVTMTLEAMRQRVLQEFQKDICLSTVKNYVERFHYTYKRIHLIPQAADTEALWEERRQYALWYATQRNNNRKLIFLDETGFRYKPCSSPTKVTT